MKTVRFYISLYGELYNVPSNMADLMDVCIGTQQGRKTVHDFITGEIRRDFTQSELEEHAQENPGSVLNTLDEIDHDSLMEDLYGGTK